jgi:hypothetical protein
MAINKFAMQWRIESRSLTTANSSKLVAKSIQMPKSRAKEVQSVSKGAGKNRIKKKIRDLERALNREGLNASKKIELERAVAALKSQLSESEVREKERKLAKKYHKVRFFERKKAMRRLNQAAKAVEEGEEGAEEKLHRCEMDWYYTLLFPSSEKYIAIFVSDERTDRQIELYREIEKKMKSGELKSGVHDGVPAALGMKEELSKR